MRLPTALLLAPLLALPPVAATAQTSAAPAVLPMGTRAIDLKVGTGPEAQPGKGVAVHYTGWLYIDGAKGKQFDSSRGRDPFVFLLGTGQVIPGWDEGLAGMKVGGQRRLIVPPQAGYGASGAGDDIPPNATLLFEVELLAVQE